LAEKSIDGAFERAPKFEAAAKAAENRGVDWLNHPSPA
jgi:hypothetical protein